MDPLPEPTLLVSGDGRVVAGNRACREKAGLDLEGMIERKLEDLVEESGSTVDHYLRKCRRSGSLVLGALNFRCGENRTAAFRCQGGRVGFQENAETGGEAGGDGEPDEDALLLIRIAPRKQAVGSFVLLNEKISDLSEEIVKVRRIEKQLTQANDRLRFVLESTGVGRWFSMPPLKGLDWDEKMHELLFVDPAVTPTMELFWERVHPDDHEMTKQVIETALSDGKVFEVENRICDPVTGRVRWLLTKGMTSFDRDEDEIRFDGISYDITPRKMAEQELKRIAAELSEANRRKSEFLATLAHELRNPLAPIRTGLEIMKMAREDPSMVERTREMMERQVIQLAVLIDDLMDISRMSSGKLELNRCQVDLRNVIQSAQEASMPLIQEGAHDFEISLPDEPIYLYADPHRLAQVFSNLLINAAKYTEKGGRIRLEAGRSDHSLYVSVEDNGVGIAPELQGRIFEMFTQIDRSTKRGYAGLGIGLTLVKSLVEMHGGEITVASEGVNRGATFTVRLPTMADPALEGEAEEEGGDRGGSGAPVRRRVLVVDDNPEAVETLSTMVGLLGHETRTSFDGGEAIRVAAEFQPEFVLMDLGMPVMNGYEAARIIRERSGDRAPRLIAVSGWGTDHVRKRALEAGFDHHLVKPADPEILRRLLASGVRD